MSEKLRVEISGDVKELEKATAKASRDLKNFEKVADKAVGGIDKPSRKSAKGINTLAGATANANPTLQEFSRVIQDAPFGIQGVGNNITQLTSNFGNLSKSAGGSKNAIKLLLSSFAGPGGVLFVISAVVSLLTVYGDKLFSNKTETEKLAEATKKASEALDKFVESQTAANRAIIQGNQNAQSELITLGQLRDVVEDTTRSTEDRKKAISELRRLFPSYFKDLSDEKILTGDLSGVYDQLTTSIIKRAKATAATNILVKNAEKEIAITARLADITDRLLKNKERSAQIDKIANQNARSGGNFGAGINSLTLATQTSGLISEAEDLRKELEKILGDSLDLSNIINDNGGIDLSKVEVKGGDGVKPLLKVSPLFEFNTEGIDLSGIQDLSNAIVAPLEDIDIPKKMSDLEFELRAAAIRFNQNASALIETSFGQTFETIGQNIGDAISQGGNIIEAAGRGILQSIGGFLSRMGSLLIEYGTLAVLKGKLDLAILTGGPVAIGAGLAAIAVGVALSAAGTAIGNAAVGGANGGSGAISSGGSSTRQSFSSGGGGFDGGKVVFEISGTKLIGVLNRTRDRNLALGG